jgi:peptidoglycan/LPS O-acetylase OafA/YrhL
MAKRYYKPELDALRFFAFLCVFIYHLRLTEHPLARLRSFGAFGMCIFFMLSSYLIVSILLRERQSTGTVSWKAFALRRVLRIWPLYFFVLFGSYWLGHFWSSSHISGRAVFAFSVLLGNLYILRHGWVLAAVDPLWSLSVEEQFYLAVPLVTRLGGQRTLAGICVATLSFSYVVLAWLGFHGADPLVTVWVNSFVQFQFFAVGGLIALRFYGAKFSCPLLPRCSMTFVGLALWLIVAMRLHLTSPIPSTPKQLLVGYFLLMVGTVLIFLSVLDLDKPIPAPLIYLGKISYGLYIFHEFAIFLVLYPHSRWIPADFVWHHSILASTLTLGLTILMAAISYHFFERPILKYKEHFETIRTRPA